MRRRGWSGWSLLLLACLPVAAFVFVPQRNGLTAKADVPSPTGQGLAKVTPSGRLVTVDATSVRAYRGNGADLWAMGGSFESFLEVTESVVLVVATPNGKRQLQALEAGRLLWSRALFDEDIYVPRPPASAEATDLGVVALLDREDGKITALGLKDGAPRGTRTIGKISGQPVAVEDSLLAIVQAPGGAQQVVMADLARVGQDGDTSVWFVPEKENIVALNWSRQGQVIIARGAKRTYVLE